MSEEFKALVLKGDGKERGDFAMINDETELGYWQPKTANGYATVRVAPALVHMDARFSVGTQILPPGGVIREHSHGGNEEVLHIIEGCGQAFIDGEEYPMVAGSTLFLGKNRKHRFVNNSDKDMKWVWFMTPNGLEDFFRDIGRVRVHGEPAPEPFERPEDVKNIEARTVFASDAKKD
ncbi:cupin domain-containing protein [Leeia sp. TBRC 13508]|uniref:Cupin domain-containing protein n=1 Tax=Leeia speluncae TaxID=2884804 RepID=A0ABS8D8X7_9NEIS|nr:cupin domain-containing protein [Leeia speluncae]MCB6184673.1 cupin domain-containing protein [Leeia speluncae]